MRLAGPADCTDALFFKAGNSYGMPLPVLMWQAAQLST